LSDVVRDLAGVSLGYGPEKFHPDRFGQLCHRFTLGDTPDRVLDHIAHEHAEDGFDEEHGGLGVNPLTFQIVKDLPGIGFSLPSVLQSIWYVVYNSPLKFGTE